MWATGSELNEVSVPRKAAGTISESSNGSHLYGRIPCPTQAYAWDEVTNGTQSDDALFNLCPLIQSTLSRRQRVTLRV